MELEFLGATGTVTGSKYLVSRRGRLLLVDCGLFQGYKQLRLRNWAKLPVRPSEIDAVVLSHAHIDHTGYLPLLVREGFRGPVYCTPATRELCGILLPDSGRLQEEDAEHANRHRYSRHRPALPLYTEADAVRALDQFEPRAPQQDFEAVSGIRVRLVPNGHLLGSVMVALDDGSRRLLFSGDMGRPDDLIMRPPQPPPDADVLVLESTYGNRRHEDVDPLRQLGDIVRDVTAGGGVVMIPAFAVGRTQTLLYCLHRLKEQGVIPRDLPVFLNSPMGIDATAIYNRHRDEHRLAPEECEAMFGAARIVNTVDESRALNQRQGPMVIIAGSGMATGGRIVHHLKAFAPDPRNAIVLTGFQAGGTRGAALAAGADSIKIHGEYIAVRAPVKTLGNLSAHADYGELLSWLGGFRRPPRRVYLTHGEPEAADALRRRIADQLGWPCEVADYRQRVDLEAL
ncbi:MBL fold metallo-hydrolase [Solimonas fluminis]|uniref:MBL fold metallo-hydrolase n=1 Tax=Solimonas fluminis TaxID=2086571 RepID=A0A2S5THB7_9GAMM|nr:MBL fold metallo-hydrolase [Solimonas fluminis]PPE74342.1 MBL fold metallo-hydrolase [Solimonas fluminis]